MKQLFTILMISLFSFSIAFGQKTDQIKTNHGTLFIQPVEHATMVMKYHSKLIFVDPASQEETLKSAGVPDIIFITDIHGDHMNPDLLKKLLLVKATLVAPKAVVEQLKDISFKKVVTLANGENTKVDGLKVEAIPMYNLPESPDAFHPKGRGNGYVITFGDKRAYISGDTEDIPEMRNLKNIDVAFVCMNLPYTMTVEQAADGVAAFKPGIVYPFHYRGKGGLSDVEKFKKLVAEKAPSVEVRLRDWYPNQ